MIHVRLWHKREPIFFPLDFILPDLQIDYSMVAEFKVNAKEPRHACELVFALSQNLDGPWYDPPMRSTSVGDLMEILDSTTGVPVELYQVDMMGMRKM